MENSFLSKKEAEQINQTVGVFFKTHPHAECVLVTIDGNLFLERDKNSATNHARMIGQKDLIILQKGDTLEGVENPVKPLSVDEVRRMEQLQQKKNIADKAKEFAEKSKADAKKAEEKRAADRKAKEAADAKKKAEATAANQELQDKAEKKRIEEEEKEAAELAELQEREAAEREAGKTGEAAEDGQAGETGGAETGSDADAGATEEVKHNAKSVEALAAEGKTNEAKAAYETLSKTQKGKVSAETKTALGITQ